MRLNKLLNKLYIIILFIMILNNKTYASSIIISSASDALFKSMNGPLTSNIKKEEVKSEDEFLKLVNYSHPIELDYVPPLTDITGGQKMHTKVAPIVEKLLVDSKADKISLYVVSGYRSSDRQGYLFNKKLQNNLSKGKKEMVAFMDAIKINPLPGTSEHQTGLCMDIVDMSYKNLDEKQEKTDGYKWMLKHCADYGFILRYPKDKTNITGIIYEPWHFRYVGVEVAKHIMQNNLTLEEYILGKIN